MNRGDELSRRRSSGSDFVLYLLRLGLSPAATSLELSSVRMTYIAMCVCTIPEVDVLFTADEKNGTPPCTYDIHVAAVTVDM